MIDIMMPFYGDVGQFREAVESVLRQTDPRWRLVVIDDRYPGTAHTEFVAAIDDARVTLVRNEVNLGVAGNFQRSIELAEAEWLVIMGCDDLLEPEYVARLHELVEQHPEVAYVQPGVRVIDDAGEFHTPLADRVKARYRPKGPMPRTMRGEELARSLLRGNWTYFPSILWRRSELVRHGFRPEFEVVLDLALQFDLVTSGGALLVDDVPAFRYRRHAVSVSSATADTGERFGEERSFFDEAERRCRELGWASAASAAHHHWSSRLNAVTRLPRAIAAGNRAGVKALTAHAVRGRPAAPATGPDDRRG